MRTVRGGDHLRAPRRRSIYSAIIRQRIGTPLQQSEAAPSLDAHVDTNQNPLASPFDRAAAVRELERMAQLGLEHFRVMVEQAPMMVWRAGIHAQFDYFNAAWLAFTGRALEQELGNGWVEGIHPHDAKPYLAIYADHFERRQPFEAEFRLRRFDGAYRYVLVRATPYKDCAGRFGGFVGSCLDIEERHAREVSSAAEDFFKMSLDNVCVAGFDGYFKQVNPSWTRTLGWTAEELMSKPVVEFVHPEDREGVLAGRQRLQTGGALGPLTNRYLCKDGTHRWFEWRSVAHLDRGLVYAVARDITEHKRSEERLREAQRVQEKLQRQLIFADRMASVGTLAAGVAHEVNNPLAYVMANLNLMLEELQRGGAESKEPWAALREMATEAQAGAERIRKIVRGLKTFSRAEEERRTVIDIQPLLEMSINMTYNEIRHRARLVKDYGKTPLVEADDARLGQVFINLLVNAAQALPEGDSTANEIRVVTSTDSAGRAVVEVRDTGSGIPSAMIERIFDPFFTTKPLGIGTGLGLSICHTIVTGMGGAISAMSEEGRGTTFRVVLPAALTKQESPAGPANPAPEVACAAVLVVDDEPVIGVVLRRALREHEVTTVTTAKEALSLLDSGRRFHIIFSDLMMPEMSGMDFYAELSRRFPDAAERVVFVSGGAFMPNAHAFLDRVPNERLDKPFTARAVRELVQRYASYKLPS